MEIKFIDFVLVYGLEPVMLALAINIVTGLIKLPLKAWAKKASDSSVYTRFLVFLPIVIGLGLTALYYFLFNGKVEINRQFVSLWLSSASLSLSFYAVFEKLVPSKNRILKDSEVEICKQILAEVLKATKDDESFKKYINNINDSTTLPDSVDSVDVATYTRNEQIEQPKKIILRGNVNERTNESEFTE